MEVTRTEFRLTLHCGITTRHKHSTLLIVSILTHNNCLNLNLISLHPSLAILAAERLETTLSALLFPSE